MTRRPSNNNEIEDILHSAQRDAALLQQYEQDGQQQEAQIASACIAEEVAALRHLLYTPAQDAKCTTSQ